MRQEHYNSTDDRAALIRQAESEGLTLVHDDFDPDWRPGQDPHGTLTFNICSPKTETEVMFEGFYQEINSEHTQVIQAINNWGQLTLAQKDKLLKLLAKFYIVSGVRMGLFSLE